MQASLVLIRNIQPPCRAMPKRALPRSSGLYTKKQRDGQAACNLAMRGIAKWVQSNRSEHALWNPDQITRIDNHARRDLVFGLDVRARSLDENRRG
jgi:hypothetical protein